MSKTKLWINRKFEFDFPAEDYSIYVERLRNTPKRVVQLLSPLNRDQLIRKNGDKWSVQENAGHLIDTEILFDGRLDDYEKSLKELRPADMTNKITFASDYNALEISEVLAKLHETRGKFMARLDSYPAEFFAQSSFHPRLEKDMRMCDMLFFQAEHDDHHIRQIEELIKQFS